MSSSNTRGRRVILIMHLGESLEHFAVGRTRSGSRLLALHPHDSRFAEAIKRW
jgi:cation transport ATPase